MSLSLQDLRSYFQSLPLPGMDALRPAVLEVIDFFDGVDAAAWGLSYHRLIAILGFWRAWVNRQCSVWDREVDSRRARADTTVRAELMASGRTTEEKVKAGVTLRPEVYEAREVLQAWLQLRDVLDGLRFAVDPRIIAQEAQLAHAEARAGP